MRFLVSILFCLLLNVGGYAESPKMRVHFIDVGQGDAILLEFPCAAVLVDTGAEMNDQFDGDDRLIKYLDDFFDTRPYLNGSLKSLVITHPHQDHTATTSAVLEKYPPENVITNGQKDVGDGKDEQRNLEKWAKKNKAGFLAVTNEKMPKGVGLVGNPVLDPVECDGVDPKITALWGGDPDDKDSGRVNMNSVVLRVDFGQASILLTGDLQGSAITGLVKNYENTNLLDVDVYKVGHHGAKNGTSVPLLKKMTPDYAVISMGSPDRNCGSRTAYAYGHPRADTIENIEDHIDNGRQRITTEKVFDGTYGDTREVSVRKAVYATGWDGQVVLESDTEGNWKVLKPAIESSRVNLNTADAVELDKLPEIGEKRAKNIVAYREEHGPFSSVEELDKVTDIGTGTIEAIRPYVTVE